MAKGILSLNNSHYNTPTEADFSPLGPDKKVELKMALGANQLTKSVRPKPLHFSRILHNLIFRALAACQLIINLPILLIENNLLDSGLNKN